jgi:oligopeptide transport system substrate-binding protein
MFEFLTQQFATGFGSNMVFYSNPAFNQALNAAQAAPTPQEAYRLAGQAQTILLTDLPTIPLLDHISSAGRSENVSSAPLSWNGLFDYENIVKP